MGYVLSKETSPALELAISKGYVSEARLQMLAELPPGYLSVLWAKLDLMGSGKKLTDAVVASRAGVSTKTVRRAQSDERFQAALHVMLKSKMRGRVDIYIQTLEQLADKGNFRATQLLLEMTEMYRPVQRIESVNMNIDKRDIGNMLPDEAKREVVKQWKLLGWSLEEFEMIWGEV